MNTEIRRAKYDEAKKVKEFDVFIGDRRIDNWRGELFIALTDGELSGFIQYNSNQFYHRPFISLVCIKEKYRRRGIASALFQKVMGIYDGIDIWTSTEDNNIEAMKLFEKLGFKNAGSLSYLNRDESKETFFVKSGGL